MLFVLFDASLVLHHPGDEIQGHPHILAMGQPCPSVKSSKRCFPLFHYRQIQTQTPTYGTLPYIFLTLR
ncbi:hypothetical protein [Serratia sp. NA_13]|uniref:hypothetical protein n=1 Tax=Serratia sp. NA_13 TaxID=3415658 RepID=UPI004046A11D